MGYLSFAVVISVASVTLFGTTLNEASAEPILARWNDNVAVDLGLGKYNGRGLYPCTDIGIENIDIINHFTLLNYRKT